MNYISGPCSVDVRLQSPYEVLAVRDAMREHNDDLRLMQDASAVHRYDENVERWKDGSYEQVYSVKSTECLESLMDALRDYGDEHATQEAVDYLLAVKLGETRIFEAAKRYRLGSEARRVLMHIEASIEIADLTDTSEMH